MLLLVGLGNPGAEYAKTRHNVGFMTVESLARRWGFGPERAKFQGLLCEGQIDTPMGAVRTLILKPQTYYNDSGHAVSAALKFHKLDPRRDLVVFHDEIDLAPGRFRMKAGGGAAGNNGIRSITAQCGGPDFRRARLGVGHPGDKSVVKNYVLSEFAKAEQPGLAALLAALGDAAPMLALRQDEKYQAEVMRLAPAEKADPRSVARGKD